MTHSKKNPLPEKSGNGTNEDSGQSKTAAAANRERKSGTARLAMRHIKNDDDYEIQTIQSYEDRDRARSILIRGNIIFVIILVAVLFVMDSYWEFDGLWIYSQSVPFSKTDLENACDRRDGYACFRLGTSYLTGSNDLPEDPAKASEYFRKGCLENEMKACVNAGWLNEQKQEHKKAFRYYQRSCDSEDELGYGCFNLGLMYFRGQGVRQDRHRALALYQISCRKTDSCYDFGFVYTRGRDNSRYYRRAETFEENSYKHNRMGCDRDTWWCFTVADYWAKGLYVDRNLPRAERFAELAIKGGSRSRVNADGYAVLGDLYRQGGEGLKADSGKAMEYYRMGCRAGSARSCIGAGRMIGDDRARLKEYEQHMLDACNLKNASACSELGNHYLVRASEIKENRELARDYLEEACRLDSLNACNLYLANFAPEDEKENSQRIESIRTRQCQLLVTEDCGPVTESR